MDLFTLGYLMVYDFEREHQECFHLKIILNPINKKQ